MGYAKVLGRHIADTDIIVNDAISKEETCCSKGHREHSLILTTAPILS